MLGDVRMRIHEQQLLMDLANRSGGEDLPPLYYRGTSRKYGLREREERCRWIGFKGQQVRLPGTQQGCEGCGRTIAQPDPHDLGRVAQQECPVLEVGVLRYDHESMRCGIGPN